MIQINERRLESDLGYRFQYMAEFIGFGSDDISAIHAAAPAIAPLAAKGTSVAATIGRNLDDRH